MSASAAKISWGGIVSLPNQPNRGEKFLRVKIGVSELERLLTHWQGVAAGERPHLHGISGGAQRLELLLEQAAQDPLVLLEVSGGAFPRPSRVWRFGQWWEEELRTFGGVEFLGESPERGVQWRPV